MEKKAEKNNILPEGMTIFVDFLYTQRRYNPSFFDILFIFRCLKILSYSIQYEWWAKKVMQNCSDLKKIKIINYDNFHYHYYK
jgi:hypothetical protein